MYATRIWYCCILAAVVLIGVTGFLSLAFPIGPRRGAVLDVTKAWLFVALIAAAQMACTSWRLGWTRRHVLRIDAGLDTPDYLLRWGTPRRRDFWLMLFIAVAFTAGLLWLSAHPNG